MQAIIAIARGSSLTPNPVVNGLSLSRVIDIFFRYGITIFVLLLFTAWVFNSQVFTIQQYKSSETFSVFSTRLYTTVNSR